MANLKDITLTGIAGTQPTPVEKFVINKYLMTHKLFNLMQFLPAGKATLMNVVASVVRYGVPDAADFRNFGEEYTPSNSEPDIVQLVLKPIGRSFTADRSLERAMGSDKSGLSAYTNQQIEQCINATITGWVKAFMQGDSTSNKKSFDGLKKYFTDNAGQKNDTALELAGGISTTNALNVELFLNEHANKVREGANVVITTREKGRPFLQTLEQHRNRGIKAIKINDVEYNTFMGMPIIDVDSALWDSEMVSSSKGVPFIFARFGENAIRTMVPADSPSAQVVNVVKPGVKRTDGGASVFVNQGGVEILSCPVLVDPYVASLCYIKETAAAAADSLKV